MTPVALAAESGEAVQQGVIDGAGAVVGLGSLLLAVAWWAYLYR